jgi:hypothetical protein
MSTDYRAELQRLLGAVENDVIDTNDGLRFQAAVNRALAALAQPEPEGPTDEEWEALKERAWDRYRTVGYQGELFIYDRDFDTALDDVRQKLAHYAHPTIEPVPVSERLPGPEDCDEEGRCWWGVPAGIADPDDERVSAACWALVGAMPNATHWRPHHAMPIPTPEGCRTGTHPV